MKLLQETGVTLGQHHVRYRLQQKRDWTGDRGYFHAWQLLMWIGYDGRWDACPTRFPLLADRRKAKRRMHRSVRALRRDTIYY